MQNRKSHYDFRLDNAALIFPPQLSHRQTTLFRVSADIDRPVEIALLEQALEAMLERCPYFRIHLRLGLFWYYLEPSATRSRVEAESRYPCIYLPYKHIGVLPFRVLAYRNRIIFETAHFLTDGTGALHFLNGLIFTYLKLRGEDIQGEGLPLRTGDNIDPEEYEDSFRKYYREGLPAAKGSSPAYQLGGWKERPPVYHIYQGTVDSCLLKKEAVRYKVTIGIYLTALLMYCIQEEMKEHKRRARPIRICVPINLRGIYPSKSMRNFALTVEPEIDPRLGYFTLEEITAKVHHFMKMEFDPKLLRRQLARNVAGQFHPLLRITPRFIKDPFMKLLYNRLGRKAFTLSFSNLGRVRIPEDMQPYIKDYQFIPPPHKQSSFITSIAYKEHTHLIFGSTVRNKGLERRFFSELRKYGIPVSIKTNRQEEADHALLP